MPVNDAAPWQATWQKEQIQTNDQVSWGLGWGIQHGINGDAIWHWGDNGCFRAFALGFFQEGHGLVLMTNGKNGHQVITRILRELGGGPFCVYPDP